MSWPQDRLPSPLVHKLSEESFGGFSGCKVQPSNLARDPRKLSRYLNVAAKPSAILTRSAMVRRMASASCDRAPCFQLPFPGP